MTDLVVVGRVGGVFGTRGWLRIQSYTRPLENILDYAPWSLRVDGEWRRFELADVRRHHRGLIVALHGVVDRDQAAALVHADIAVTRAQLGDAGPAAWFWADLIGLAVTNLGGVPLGRVRGLYDTAAHDVLQITDADGRERLIPFVRDVYVVDVDVAGGTLTVDWHPDD
ncbi:MAG: ribosome maturation factor RimM [Gammaproteobacteria bacterium]|nr:ribosome maturation factor RimM [Gammaproteobacteria bacterium]